jgi:hypothetical protein
MCTYKWAQGVSFNWGRTLTSPQHVVLNSRSHTIRLMIPCILCQVPCTSQLWVVNFVNVESARGTNIPRHPHSTSSHDMHPSCVIMLRSVPPGLVPFVTGNWRIAINAFDEELETIRAPSDGVVHGHSCSILNIVTRYANNYYHVLFQ